MISTIHSEHLIKVVNELISQRQDAGDGYKDGMNYILEGLKKYIKGPDFVLSEDFESFALQHYLDNDKNKLHTFSQLIELFKIKMNKLNRNSNWNVYPEELDSDIFYTLVKCFDGINITVPGTDFDREAITIDLNINVENKNGEKCRISINDDGYISYNTFNDDEGDYYHELNKLTDYLNESTHYEVLVLFVCLKKFYQYINPQNVQQLLQDEKKES